MLLSTDGIRLSKPGAELSVDLGWRHKAEVMDMIPGRNGVDAAEAWVWQSAGEDDVTIEPVLPRRDLGKRHPHLKGNARFLWEYYDRPTRGDRPADCFEKQTDSPILALKVVGQVVPAAGMRLIVVGKATLATGTGPEWPTVLYGHVRHGVDGSYLFNNAGQFNTTVMAGRSPSLIGVLMRIDFPHPASSKRCRDHKGAEASAGSERQRPRDYTGVTAVLEGLLVSGWADPGGPRRKAGVRLKIRLDRIYVRRWSYNRRPER
jgi:hypothetical protein